MVKKRIPIATATSTSTPTKGPATILHQAVNRYKDSYEMNPMPCIGQPNIILETEQFKKKEIIL